MTEKTPNLVQKYFYAQVICSDREGESIRTFPISLLGTPELAAVTEIIITNNLGYLDKKKQRIPHFEDSKMGLQAHLAAMNQRTREADWFTQRLVASSALIQLVQTEDDIIGAIKYIEDTVHPKIERLREERDLYEKSYQEVAGYLREIHALACKKR